MRRALVAASLLLAACGGGDGAGGNGDGGVLADAEAHLAGLTAGTLELELAASTDGSGPVGFRVEGPFEFADGELPVLDLTYTRLLGAEEQQVRIVSDGETITVDGVEVPADRLGALRLDHGGEGVGLEALDLAEWVDDPETSEDGDTTTVTGDLDASAMLRDLNRVASEVAGAEGLAQLDDAAAADLEERVQDSSVEVVTEGDDHRLRSLEAVVDFGTEVPEGLEEALGPYAAARLELRLALS